jgi:hypothetical protein
MKNQLPRLATKRQLFQSLTQKTLKFSLILQLETKARKTMSKNVLFLSFSKMSQKPVKTSEVFVQENTGVKVNTTRETSSTELSMGL